MSEETKEYILIAGLPRSGSTLLQAVLNQSDSTFTMPETHFFEQAAKITDDLQMTTNQALELLDALNTKWNVATQPLTMKLQAYKKESKIDLCELYFLLIDQHCPASSDFGIGIEKTPGNLFALDKLLNQQCNFKVILTTRNPIDFASSLIKQYWSPDSILKISYLWNMSMHRINELKKNYPTRVMALDYDEMITHPEQAFSSVYQFTGLDWKHEYLLDINAKAGEFITSFEADWKSENVNQSFVNKSVKKSSLSLKQRLLLHRECSITALGIGYIRNYKI